MFFPFRKTKKIAEQLEKIDHGQSYWSIVKRQFRKNRAAVWSLRFLIVIVIIGLSADFIANDKPLYCTYKGKTYFPVLKSYGVALGINSWPPELTNVTDWSRLDYGSVLFPLIPYSPTKMDFKNKDFVSPFAKQDVKSWRWRHWLGTDKYGKDIMAGMVHGARVAVMVGVVAMSIASVIGIFLGAMAGYFGDRRLKASRAQIILNLLFLYFAYFYAFESKAQLIGVSSSFFGFIGHSLFSIALFVGIMTIPYFLAKLFRKNKYFGRRISIPVDILISRFIEIFVSIPVLLLILAVISLIEEPSLYIVMAIIGLTRWTGIARLIRGELLKVRSLEYIEAAQAMGFSERRIIMRHAIPNALTSVLIAIAFGVASAILTESFLSFLGIGVPPEEVTWGKMLNGARSYFAAWWLAIFPGLAIFAVVTIFNLLGDGLTDALDPRLKQ